MPVHKPEIDAAIAGVIDRTAFVGADEVRAFEHEFAAYCAATPSERFGQQYSWNPSATLHCVGCANGTDAIFLALRGLGIGPGDEVITVAHTFTATAEAIVFAGARPVFVDIREDTMLMDPDAIEAAITPRTRAIIAVHLYGQTCEMDRIMEIARRHGLKVVEDAAQAHGARWQGRRAGSLGDVAAFSFYPGKNLDAYGDGGAVVSADQALIDRIRSLADHGRIDKYVHGTVGVNSRLDGIQAAVLRVKLQHLDDWNQSRRDHAVRYLDSLIGTGLELPMIHPDAESVWHLFVVRTADPEQVRAELDRVGIATGFHYPLPLHLQPCYAELNIPRGTLPVTERVASRVISLPIYPELPRAAMVQIARTWRSSLGVK